MKRMIMLISEGFEETEAVFTADILKRAGVIVDICSISPDRTVAGAHNIRLNADKSLSAFNAASEAADIYDGVVMPGGLKNAHTLRDDARIADMIKAFARKGKIMAAVCAAPCVFEKLGLLKDRRVTSYPGCIDPSSCGEYTQERAVIDGNIITGRSAGTAADFAFAILKGLGLGDEAEKISKDIIL